MTSVLQTLENLFGSASLIIWSLTLVPQIVHTYQRQSTRGIAFLMLYLWYSGTLLLCPFVIYRAVSIPLRIQPHSFALLSAITLIQYIYYGPRKPRNPPRKLFACKPCRKRSLTSGATPTVKIHAPLAPLSSDCSSVQIDPLPLDIDQLEIKEDAELSTDDLNANMEDPQGSVLWPRCSCLGWWNQFDRYLASKDRSLVFRLRDCLGVLVVLGLQWAIVEGGFYYLLRKTESVELEAFLAICPGVLTIIGMIPQTLTVVRQKSAKGLSMTFLVVDTIGGVFGVLSLVFKSIHEQSSFDGLTAVLYLVVCAGNIVFMSFHCIYRNTKET